MSWLGGALIWLFAVIASAASLEEGWVSFDGVTSTPQPVRVEVLSSSLSEVVLRLSVPGMMVEHVTEDGDEYDRLSLPGYEHSGAVGSPAMPAVRQLVAVPRDCEVAVAVVALDSLLFSDAFVYPVEQIVTRYTEQGWPYLVEEFAKDAGAYSRADCFPAAAAMVGKVGSFRGQGVVQVEASPIRFTPSSGELVVTPTMLVTLSITGGTGTTAENIGPFTEIASKLVLGYDGSGEIGWRGPGNAGSWGVKRSLAGCDSLGTDYLMIVEGSLMSSHALRTLAAHRTTYNGWNVAIVPDTTVTGGGVISAEAIHDFVQEVYELGTAEHMSDGYLGYLLLVGDAREGEPNSLLPACEFDAGSDALTSDHWYACVDGEGYFPDLCIGRMCVSDTFELAEEVRRTTDYEAGAISSESWRSRAVLANGFAWLNCGNSTDEAKSNSVHAHFDTISVKLAAAGVSVQELHAHEILPAVDCGDQIVQLRSLMQDAVNGGARFVEMCTHGWYHECNGFNWERVDDLTNIDSLAFWVSYACWTGAYDKTECEGGGGPYGCFGENLMHETSGGGAVAFLGSSEGCGSPWADIGAYLWDALFESEQHRIGDAVVFAKIRHMTLTDTEPLCRDNGNHVMFNLLGDPALDLFLADTGGQGYSSAPDYVIHDHDIELSPAYPSAGTSASVAVEVRNESNYTPEDPVDVLFLLWNSEHAEWDTLGWDEVQPGDWSSDVASVQWSPDESDIGRTQLHVCVDPDGEQDELSEFNNDAERPICVYFERDGFPRNMWGCDGVAPTFVDLDSDGHDDVVSGTRVPGRIAAFCSSPADSLWAHAFPSGMSLLGSVAIADLNVDGEQEIVFTRTGCVDVLKLDGSTPNGWWSPRAQTTELLGSAALADLDEDSGPGDVEIIVEFETDGAQTLHGVRVIDHDGSGDVWDVSYMVPHTTVSLLERAPLAVDITGDGRCEVVASHLSSQFLGAASSISVHATDDGSVLWSAESPGELFCSPVAADVVVDSTGIEILFAAGTLLCLSSQGHECWEYDIVGAPAGIAVCDMNGDGSPEIVVSTHHELESLEDCAGVLYVFDAAGSVVDSFATDRGFTTQPVMADFDGDGYVEIVVISCRKEILDAEAKMTSHLEIMTLNTSLPPALEPFDGIEQPLLFWGLTTGTPSVRDTDGDKSLEIWLADGEGFLHCLDFAEINLSGAPSRWSCFQHDERHTGVYETPVSGPYPEDTDASWWGDYLLTGDVTIDATSSLLVQPGTTVRVVADDDDQSTWDPSVTDFVILGRMVAKGDTSLAPTRFLSADDDPSPGDWYGIRPQPGSKTYVGGCTIRDAHIGVSASGPDSLLVEGSLISGCEAAGVRCADERGPGNVIISGNRISDVQIGVDLISSKATVDGNTIANCGSYGINTRTDYESSITDNAITFSVSGSPFAGIRIDNTENTKGDSLIIAGNTITNAAFSGIICDGQHFRSTVSIRDNAIIDEHTPAVAKGMYFYESRAIPRLNRMEGVQDGFWIELSQLVGPPNLGITMGDGGYNCVDGALLRYGVRADPYCLTTVRAEGNWWGTANPGEPLFTGLVDWQPFLVDDAPCDSAGRGGGGELSNSQDAIVPFCLVQNAPNPFNPTTSLRLGLPAEQHVTLAVYNLAGRCVRRLVDGALDPGWHDVVWDGRDDDHRQVASGVYFCRLESQGSASVKKVVLLK